MGFVVKSNSILKETKNSKIASTNPLKPVFYPFYGILYFIAHSALWRVCFYALLVTIMLTAISLFGFGLLLPLTRSALVSVKVPYWLSTILSVVFWLLESALCVFLVVIFVVMPYLGDVIFDETIKLKGYSILLENKPRNNAGRVFAASIKVSLVQFIIFILSLPINIVPVVGTALFALINAYYLTLSLKLHYEVELMDLAYTQFKQKAKRNRVGYISFGFIALMLDLVPFLNWFLMFTNVVGAALWSLDEYKQQNKTYNCDSNKNLDDHKTIV